jgi:hypothetical protein
MMKPRLSVLGLPCVVFLFCAAAGAGLASGSGSAGRTDIAIGQIANIAEIARVGTFPEGTSAISMGTTACNAGSAALPWLAPMAEEHPVIVFQLYRELDGRFEQIGISDARHGFFALPQSACEPCQDPSGDGTLLAPGCSTTNSAATNADQTWLGPRGEINPFLGTWSCEGSHFAGGEPDCVRRHTGEEHGPLDHRLTARDEDLGVAGAVYYCEAYYLTAGDVSKGNNLGSRRCTMQYLTDHWLFTLPAGNPLEPGPALARWGGDATWAEVPGDGNVLLSVKVSELGGGLYNYEYALFNLDSDRRIRRISIPVGSASIVEHVGFHDPDGPGDDDWASSLASGTRTWDTDSLSVDPEANALGFGELFNFRFDADAPPVPGQASLETWKLGPDNVFTVQTTIPGIVLDVSPSRGPAAALHLRFDPSPFLGRTTIRFDLPEPAEVRLEIFDTGGRRVASLIRGREEAGPHEVPWNPSNGSGAGAVSGVYYCRLQAGDLRSTRSILLLD